MCNLSSVVPAQRDADADVDADADIDGDAGDDDKGSQENDEEALTEAVSEAGGDAVGQQDDQTAKDQAAYADKCGLSTSELQGQPDEPVASVNGQPETDNKENNNGINADETQAIR